MAKAKLAYVTLLDQYHPGIYDSQVIDVCHYLQNNFNVRIKLIAFLSIRELRNTEAKSIIKSKYPDSWVLPAFPKLQYFKLTKHLLALALTVYRCQGLICRNVFATQIGLFCKKIGLVNKIAFDGRSALASEIKEYDVFPVPYLRNNIAKFEEISVLDTDFQLAISNALINYWRDGYEYNLDSNVVVPCTLHTDFDWTFKESISDSEPVKVVYAGSNAPWQGFKEIINFLRKNEEVHCTLLTKESGFTQEMEKEFGNRLQVRWVNSEEVAGELAKHDYGLLLRPQTVTNKVASPGKFAEYLACGLQVVLTPNLGDCSQFVETHQCGLVWDGQADIKLSKATLEQKKYCHQLANSFYKKESTLIHQNYQLLINALTHG